MPEPGAFRQVDEKHVAFEAELMVWSPKFDLVALSNLQGEVVLHRLSWQKVWSLPPPGEEVKVKAMAWRCDGKVLAVGYTSGTVNLCYIENADILHSLSVPGEVTCLSWICQASPEGQTWSCDPYPEDKSDHYLPRLQPLNKSYGTLTKGAVEENVEDKKKLKTQKELNILVVGSSTNKLNLFIYGVFPVATVTISEQNGSEPRRIMSAIVSEDLNSLLVFVELGREDSTEVEYTLLTFDTTLLSSRDKELHLLALKFGQVATLIDYLQATIQQMTEAWETILLEMDSKLYNFAEQKQAAGGGTVGNDFLELLLFGTPSAELQTFLLHELTDKGLKKLGHSIETSYSNIQKLVVKHLQSVSQAIVYHMSEVKGMFLCYEKFGVLGLEEKSLQNAVMKAGSFVLKTSELQQVIDGSIKNFKAFFRWLYVVILRLSDEKPPPELSKREEAESIADLRAVSPTDKKPGFKLEKVGQYLKKEDLHYPPDIAGNPWIQFCRASYHLKDPDEMARYEPAHLDLHCLPKPLKRPVGLKGLIIIGAIIRPPDKVGHCYEVCQADSVTVIDDNGKPFMPKVSQFTSTESKLLYTVFTADFLPCERLFVLRQPTNSHSITGNIQITPVKFGRLHPPDHDSSVGSNCDRCDNHKVIDLMCYDDKHLAVLLIEDTDDEIPVLVKLPLSLLPDSSYINMSATASVTTSSDIPLLDMSDHGLDNQHYRRLENMKAHSFAVSGTRHTATVLFSSRRRVRIFLMDAEDDDELEDTNMSNQSAASTQSEADALSQSATSMIIEGGTDGGGEEGKENKENTSLISEEGEEGQT